RRLRSLGLMRKDTRIMVYQEKIASPRREPADVLLCQLKIKSLEQENARLKERLAQILRGKTVELDSAPGV
ncbi:MAG: hypothetical protein QOF72_611, partial [Blastocatellia bacterium]|nr:hypothetical protein [Blastocatellia bacterium]